MAIFDGLWRRMKSVSGDFAEQQNPLHDMEPVNDFGTGRQSRPGFTFGGGGLGGSLPKLTSRQLGITENQLKSLSIDAMVDILTDAHPDVGFALWNFLRLGNSGYTITCSKLNTGKPFPRADKAIAEFIRRISLPNVERFELNRDFSEVLGKLILTTVTRGSAALELVMTPGLDAVAFLAPIDPATVEFKFEQDRFVPYQDDGKISLDIPSFFYGGLDSRVDDPYGRSPLVNAINTVFFQMQVLDDIRSVVHNQGYPRFDITILEEVLIQRMPIQVRQNEKKRAEWLNNRLEEIAEAYNGLDPDDAFVHFDSVKIEMVNGQKSSGAMIDPEKLMAVIDSQIMTGLKTLSTLLGRRSSGDSESFAKIEIKLSMLGLDAVQQVVESIISKALVMVLNIEGIQSSVEFKFDDVEIRTELEKAQFEQIHLMNCAYKRDQGWIDQRDASLLAVGKEPVSETPLNNQVPTNKEGDPVQGSPDVVETDGDGEE